MTETQDQSTDFQQYRTVLTVAGSDCSGGAGIQADLKTFGALGCYGMSAITALTAQNTTGVYDIHAVPASFVAGQLDVVFSDIRVHAVKIGMLFSVEVIEAVADRLKRYDAGPVVLDPVMVAQSGDKLLKDDAIDAVKQLLAPLACVITPNLPEAAVMLNRPIASLSEMEAAARDITGFGAGAALIKGGHLESRERTDALYIRKGDRFAAIQGDYIHTRNNHGTGCTLSSAIAAFLARGADTEAAVRQAKAYITEAIRMGAPYRLGNGHGPVHHFHQFWRLPSIETSDTSDGPA